MACREQHRTQRPNEGRPLSEISCPIQLSSQATRDLLLLVSLGGCFGENGTMSKVNMEIFSCFEMIEIDEINMKNNDKKL